MTCCNHDCRQGRDCPFRERRPVPRRVMIGLIIALAAFLALFAAPDLAAWSNGQPPITGGQND
jgi:hypothetical protein